MQTLAIVISVMWRDAVHAPTHSLFIHFSLPLSFFEHFSFLSFPPRLPNSLTNLLNNKDIDINLLQILVGMNSWFSSNNIVSSQCNPDDGLLSS
jgi:hypothetical protein